MAIRRSRASRRLVVLIVVLAVLLGASLLAGVLVAAHRSPAYRHSVDHSFAGAASTVVESSNVTGAGLAVVMADPGALGRALLESRLQSLDQSAQGELAQSLRLDPPPPSADAEVRLVDTMRLRAEAVASVRATLEGLLGLTPTNPVGTAGPEPAPAPVIAVPGAEARLRLAGEQMVLADHHYAGLPFIFNVATGNLLPPSLWTSPATGRLMPATLLGDASTIASDPRLAATISLSIVAVQTQPLLLPVGPGYPVPPTTTFTASVAVVNAGTAPSEVTAIIRAQPLGRSPGHFDSGRATGAVAAGGAVALQLPAMAVVPGEHVLITIDIVKPRRQLSEAGLRWVRTVVVGQDAPVG